jgi:hypothetical protein
MRTLIGLCALYALPAWCQQPQIQNARMETRAAGGDLGATMSSILSGQSGPAWIGYAAAAIAGERQMCCWNSNVCCAGCRLESGTSEINAPVTRGPIRLEAPKEFFVLYRIDQRKVDKVRTFSVDCALDGGDVPFIWLTGVRPEQSVAFLSTLVRERDRLSDGAINAIALHADPAADRALDGFVDATRPEEVRRKAAFWLGNARGRHGYDTLVRTLQSDPSDRVREHAIFALTQSKEADAVKTIIQTAREDKSPRVRGQALFWLAQKAQRQIASTAIAEAIEKDPETEVKKKAVFALTQIPQGDGVPMLIQVAKTNTNPAVRKQAMFWLGQSKDQRALKFFEEVLTH